VTSAQKAKNWTILEILQQGTGDGYEFLKWTIGSLNWKCQSDISVNAPNNY
jgi:hypothetical protein